jgi:hypothetical protein
VQVEASIVLSPGGLGVADFGDEVADVLAALEPHVGEPDVDETTHREEADAPPGGVCAGGYSCWEYIRQAEWSNVGLSLTFSDLWWEPGMEAPYPKVPMSFVAYWVVGPQLSTAEGIGVGASVADLEAAFGAMLTLDTDFDLGPFFSVVLDDSGSWFGGAGFHGLLSASPTDSASAVLSITAGRPSSW